jgi:hypothetical protein
MNEDETGGTNREFIFTCEFAAPRELGFKV